MDLHKTENINPNDTYLREESSSLGSTFLTKICSTNGSSSA